MGDEKLLEQVRALRAQGHSPKAIARTLDVRPAQVAPLVRVIAKERKAVGPEPGVDCWLSPGWSAGLAVPRGRGWPDRRSRGAEGSGLVGVLVARERPRDPGRVSVCGYLVDTYCLGIKDAVGPRTMSPDEARRFLGLFFGAFDAAPVEAPLELARQLVWGAVAYARELGFQPHRDFAPVAGHLGRLDGPSVIGFGHHGKPHYIQGPYDDADRILRTLEDNLGAGNFHFTVELGPDRLTPSLV